MMTLQTPFWLDTNVFVEAKNRYYTFERVPKFWKFLDEKINDGTVCSPKMVFNELTSYRDHLATWVKARKQKGLCVKPVEQIQKQFTMIADHIVSTFPRHRAEEFLSGADPWLIASALHVGGTVVTQESSSRGGKIRIPAVCQHFDIRCIDTFEMLNLLKARF